MHPTPTSDPASTAAAWRSALDAMSPHASPCRHLPPARWAEISGHALDFVDRLGPEAARLGWTAAELFGVHPEHGTLRVDACGALMVAPVRVSGVEPGRVVFERTAHYRGRPGQVAGVPVWEFEGRKGLR